MNPTASKVPLVEAKGLLVTSRLIPDSSHNVQQDARSTGLSDYVK